jgi:SagB-type dehydrogenase family enzyme
MAMLWAAQGVTLAPDEADRVDGLGLRASPSAGATYPLETYLLAVRVDGLQPGLYHYLPQGNSLESTGLMGDLSAPVAEACLGQRVVSTASAVIVFAAVMERTARRYHQRAERYVMMELGHANQNAHLMATARGLGACAIGAFRDPDLQEVLRLPEDHVPTYLLAVGHPQS